MKARVCIVAVKRGKRWEIKLADFPPEIADYDPEIKERKISAVHIRYIAIDERYQHNKIGTFTIQTIIKSVKMLAVNWPIRVITIDAREELFYNKSIMEQIDHNITIMEKENGYDAEIEDLDLGFLEETSKNSLDGIEITWTLNIQKEEFFYSSSNNEVQAQMIVETHKTSAYENMTSDRISLLAA